MYNNKRSVMGKWKRTLIAAALTASMILALPVWNVGRAEAAPDVSAKSCSLTVQHSNEARENAEKLNITVDLYRVAHIDTSFTGYDGYKLELEGAYEALGTDFSNAQKSMGGNDVSGNNAGANAAYRDLAQKAAEIALGQNGSAAQGKVDSLQMEITNDGGVKSATFGSPDAGIDAGMYLVVAHGTELQTPNDYVAYVGEGASRKLVTIADNKQYVYRYFPELIALPMRANDEGGVPENSFNTADRTDWLQDVTVFLKNEEVQRYASLEIVKKLDKAPLSDDSCVFEITAELEGETVYHSFKSVDFKKSETEKTILVTGHLIPVGAKITVTEVFSGASYTIDSADNKTQTIPNALPDAIVPETNKPIINNRLEFNNERQFSGAGSSSITNNFKFSTENDWEWTTDRPNDEIRPNT